MTLSHQSNLELMWWVNNIDSAFKPILQSTPAVILTTDASTLGWGAVLGDTRTGGPWDQTEQQYHINCLEMRAVLLGLIFLCKHVSKQHVRVQCDNTTAIAYINAMGGIKSKECDNLAKLIWEWCLAQDVWLSACHIPGSQNVEADFPPGVCRHCKEMGKF